MKKSPINKVSKTRGKALREYAKVRKEYLEVYYVCAVCGFYAKEIHHKKGRVGKLLCDSKLFLSVCSSCHKTITDNPKWATEKGYSLDRLAR